MSDPLVGRRLGGYRLEAVLGRGSFATVYLGRDAAAGDRAIKVLDRSAARHWDFRARFRREADLVLRLRHPHIVRVDGFGVEEVAYLVMELVSPRTLADEIRAGTQLAGPFEEWVAQAAAALDHAHERRVVHRDVKPANLLIGDGGRRACLADFGIARMVRESGLTRTGLAIGSCAYMAPEQCLGEVHELDGRADVYAFAVTLFEAVTGRVPFGRGEAAVQGHLREPPPPASRFNRGLPEAVDPVLARGMAKRPGDRHQAAGRLADAFLRAFAARVPVPFGPALELGGLLLPLTRSSTVVGRRSATSVPELDLSAADPDQRVSRRHAELVRAAGFTAVRDLGSRNGTAVNGRRLEPSAPCPLSDGDRLGFGGVEALYRGAVAWPCGAGVRAGEAG